MLDPTGRVASWNAGAERIKGYRPRDIIGRHFSVFYTPEDARRGKPDYALRTAVDEGHWSDEGWRVRQDGGRFWASVVITALHDAQGDLVGFAKVTRDLTARKRAEEDRAQLLRQEQATRAAAERAAERLRITQQVTDVALAHLQLEDLLVSLLERIGDALALDTAVLLLQEGERLICRAAWGLPEAEHPSAAIGEGFAGRIAATRRPRAADSAFHPEELDSFAREHGVRALLGVPLVLEGRLLGVLQAGSRRERRFSPDDVELLQLVADRVAVAVDRARLVDAERLAREDAAVAAAAVRVRDEFFSVAAHELKTPVTSLRGQAQLARRRLERALTAADAGALAGLTPEGEALIGRVRESLMVIDGQSGKLARLIDRLLDGTRLEAGRLALDRQPADLAELAREVARTVQVTVSEHALVVDAPEPVVAVVDALRLDQVLTNLLENATKFSPEGGEVAITVRRDGPHRATVAVRDHGIGVPPEKRERIFDRFFQAHATGHLGGLGLGLYVSRQIVELHGGSIAAEFPDDGGTRFVVTLPLGT